MNPEVWEGFRERSTLLNPIFMLGKGMDVGVNLNPYLPQVCLAVLLEVFYREIKDDDRRHFSDIKQIVVDALEVQGLEMDEERTDRIANGLISYGPPQSRQAFTGKVFEPASGEFIDKPFFYLVIDTSYSKKRDALYKLTQISQNMIFLSREVILEFSIEFEQLYTLKLIRTNNFRSALQSLDMLITKVRNLIGHELEYRRQFLRNPKILMGPDKESRKERKNDVDLQVEEANERFESMLRLLQKSDVAIPEARGQIMEMEMKVRATSALTAKLHAHMYENLELELSIRKNRPSAFMRKKNTSLKTDVWENELLAKGIPAPDTLDLLLSPLFSPRPPFVYPMGWIWNEQEVQIQEETEPEEEPEEETAVQKPQRDWSGMCKLWTPVMQELLNNGFVHLRSQSVRDWTLEALEMWMIFKTGKLDVPQQITTYLVYPDERMELIRHLIMQDPVFLELAGSTITARFEKETPLHFMGVRISSITLMIHKKEA